MPAYKKPEDILANPESGDEFWLANGNSVKVESKDGDSLYIRFNNDEKGFAVILTTFRDICRDIVEEMSHHPKRTVQEIMRDPWATDEIETTTHGKISIISKVGGCYGIVKVLICNTGEEIQMTVREFQRRYKDYLIK